MREVLALSAELPECLASFLPPPSAVLFVLCFGASQVCGTCCSHRLSLSLGYGSLFLWFRFQLKSLTKGCVREEICQWSFRGLRDSLSLELLVNPPSL